MASYPPWMKDQTEAPTLDMSRRPRVKRPGGKYSTLDSASSGDSRGELLYPQVSQDGRIMDGKEAYATAVKTGQHLGRYRTPEAATAAAKQFSREQVARKKYGQLKITKRTMSKR